MDANTFTLLLNGGALGLIVFLFIKDVLVTKKASDERVAEVSKQWSERFTEMRNDRNEWKKLALGSEQRVDAAVPIVAAALDAPVPSQPSPGSLVEDHRRADRVRRGRRT